VSWDERAQELAAEITHPRSRWHPLVSVLPRHRLVPAWWEGNVNAGWRRRDAEAFPQAPFGNRSLVTQVGTAHADDAPAGAVAHGPATSSATKPGLVVALCRLAMIVDGLDVLDAGTGSGYGCALLCLRCGDGHVTTIDVDPRLTEPATRRLGEVKLHPKVITGDATAPLDGEFDRIVSTLSVSPVPASWLAALRPGGRLVTTITGTGLLVTADKTADGGATGHVEWYRAGFMRGRSGPGYPPPLLDNHPQAVDGEGAEVSASPFPVPRQWSWELHSNLALIVPGIEDHYEQGPGGLRIAWLLAPDGSWARAEQKEGGPAFVHQSGPRKLWDCLDELRREWLTEGVLPAYGSRVAIDPRGAITFSRGSWSATIGPEAAALEPGDGPRFIA
jgi:protein-L-isoaspartate O-methyltransferase